MSNSLRLFRVFDFAIRVVFASAAALLCLRPLAAATMSLHADLREAPRGLLHATIEIPVQPGSLTLLYPRWIPGEHGPTGPVTDLSGLKLSAGGRPLAWRRDLENMHAIHLEVPAGVEVLKVDVDYLAPSGGGFTAGPCTSAHLAVLNWNVLTLMPKGRTAADIVVTPSVTLPAGWKFGCSMEVAQQSGASVTFKPVTLEMLIDQPLITGRHFQRFDLTPGATPSHVIDCAADSAAALAMSPDRLKAYQRVPVEFAALMGTRHYEKYHFLLALSDRTGSFGLEHHQCSDNRALERTLIDDTLFTDFAVLLTHEYFHSWNGKHRRPAGMLSPDFQRPVHTDLLWIYEGLTNYYGEVMAARTGLNSAEEFRDCLAAEAAWLASQKGREWRPLQDTADAAQVLYGSSRAWQSRRRTVDFYAEGSLIWLDADVLIRTKTSGAKSLDDFVRAFFGDRAATRIDPDRVAGRKPTVEPYELEDLLAALNRVLPYDWKGFFAHRVTAATPEPPMAGITSGGWNLVHTETPNKLIESWSKGGKSANFTYSLGLQLNTEDQAILDVIAGSPADKAGVGPGMKLIGVNGRKYSSDVLADALKATKDGTPIELLLENNEFFSTHRLDYSGGPRHPHLERIEGNADLLAEIIKPRATATVGTGAKVGL